jgi:YVTN family beta-propeller protein
MLLSVFIISILSALYGVSTAQTVNTSLVTKYPGFTVYTLILANDTLVQGNVDSFFQGYVPDTILYNPQNGYIYVGDAYSQMISVINPMNRSVVAIIKIQASPSSMAYDPENGYLFVGTRYGPMVIINTHNNSVVSYDRSYCNIIGIIYDKQNGYLYAVGHGHHVHVINPNTLSDIANITVSTSYATLSIGYNTQNGYIYVGFGGKITIINPETNTVVKNITVGGCPESITYDPNNGYLYVSSATGFTWSILAVNPNIPSIIKVGTTKGPANLMYDPISNYVYVASQSGGILSLINPETNSIVRNISLSSGLWAMSYNPNNGYVYLTNYNNCVVVFDPNNNSILENIPLVFYPISMAYDPENCYLYVANLEGNDVYVISTENYHVVTVIPVGRDPDYVFYDPQNGYIYVANLNSSFISVINPNTNTVIKNINISSGATDIILDPNNGDLYVLTPYSNNLSSVAYVISTKNDSVVEVLSTEAISGTEHQGVYVPDTGYIYMDDCGDYIGVFNPDNDSTSDILYSTLLSSKLFASSMLYDPTNGYLYVIAYSLGTYITSIMLDGNTIYNYSLLIINPHTNDVISNISNISVSFPYINQVGSLFLNPYLMYDQANGYIYISTVSGNNVLVLDPSNNSIIANISVGYLPYSMAYNSNNGDIYVANIASGTISIIVPQPKPIPKYVNLKFVAEGLPTGLTWRLILCNLEEKQNISLTFSYPVISLSNFTTGVYRYVIIPPQGYTVYPSSGVINLTTNSEIELYFKPITSTSTTTTSSILSTVSVPTQPTSVSEGLPAPPLVIVGVITAIIIGVIVAIVRVSRK